ncbi:acyltransferase [Protofrankia symbiont of Coriaria ruscifolia]|uniref:Putative acetyltransferase Rv3034c n=1 Tax=Candidatus Protofrankia californiensis TaxID=1839754 RepID=A0A1C3PEW3_9ACTN|nr:acyltransferase [Protofrankia symbiont of Coriaria ruscifolia]SBW28178.1 putative acetyltransferase Rv3034c [Candidatus Protofrankia californiensis]
MRIFGGRANRDPRQGRFLTFASARWIVRHRAWTPFHLRRYWRFVVFRLRYPQVVTEGFVFLGKNVGIEGRPGYGRIVLGRWVHLGDNSRIRCHEGNLRIGDKCVLGRNNTVNCYLDVEIGAKSLIADDVYIIDFDHVFSDIHVPIKDQGLAKSPVRIGADVWIGTKVTVLRGSRIGSGSVIAAGAVVNTDIAPMSVAVGMPARVMRNRVEGYQAAEAKRAALADIARKTAAAAAPVIAARAGAGRSRQK